MSKQDAGARYPGQQGGRANWYNSVPGRAGEGRAEGDFFPFLGGGCVCVCVQDVDGPEEAVVFDIEPPSNRNVKNAAQIAQSYMPCAERSFDFCCCISNILRKN